MVVFGNGKYVVLVVVLIGFLVGPTPVVIDPVADQLVEYSTPFSVEITRSRFETSDRRGVGLSIKSTIPDWMTKERKSAKLLGKIDLLGYARGVFIQGNRSYVACDRIGFVIFDISTPSSPVLLGYYQSDDVDGDPSDGFDIVVDGDLAYLADGVKGIKIFNISDPSNPKLVYSKYYFFATRIFKKDDYVFVGYDKGWSILSAVEPFGEIKKETSLAVVAGIHVDDNYTMYMIEVGVNLVIYNVTDVTNPVKIKSFSLPGHAEDLYVIGHYVYIANAGGLVIVNVNDTSSPVQESYLGISGDAQVIFVEGDYAYIGTGPADHDVDIINVADVTSPFSVKRIVNQNPMGLFVKDDVLYVGADLAGLKVWDVTTKSDPQLISTYETVEYGYSVDYKDDVAYVGGNNGIACIDISDPTNPRWTKTIMTGEINSYAWQVQVLDDLLFWADGRAGVKSYNITSGVILKKYFTTEAFGIMVLKENPEDPNTSYLLYIADKGNYLRIMRIQPDIVTYALIGFAPEPPTVSSTYGVFVRGHYAYLGCGSAGLFIVDVSDPSVPETIGSYNPGSAGVYGAFVEKNGDVLYVIDVSSAILTLLNVTNKTNPEVLSQVSLPDNVQDIVVRGDHAYVALKDEGVVILDVKNKTNVSIIQTIPTGTVGSRETNSIFVGDGDYIMTTESQYGFAILQSDGSYTLSGTPAKKDCGDTLIQVEGSDETGDVIDSFLVNVRGDRYGYVDKTCNVYKCGGMLSNVSVSNCSGHGYCDSDDVIPSIGRKCVCQEFYYGVRCDTTTCFGGWTNSTGSPCGVHGVCRSHDHCVCSENYYGDLCNVTTCGGVLSNTTDVCSDKGFCDGFDVCVCRPDYFGMACNVTTCDGVLSNTTDRSRLCTGHGFCNEINVCSCDLNYYGDICKVATCHFVLGNDSSVCSGQGDCDETDKCLCHQNYYGIFCNVSECFDILSNDTSSCGDSGSCKDYNHCECLTRYYGEQCNITECFSILSNDSKSCGNHGECTNYDTCLCSSDYYGKLCNVSDCYGVLSNHSSSCGSHGKCEDHNYCVCDSMYYGDLCNITICGGVFSNETNSCFGHGSCMDSRCECETDYYGDSCNITSCQSFLSNDSRACGSGGDCIDFDHCNCSSEGYYGTPSTGCSNRTICGGIYGNLTDIVCSGNGSCVHNETSNSDYCICDYGYTAIENETLCMIIIPVSPHHNKNDRGAGDDEKDPNADGSDVGLILGISLGSTFFAIGSCLLLLVLTFCCVICVVLCIPICFILCIGCGTLCYGQQKLQEKRMMKKYGYKGDHFEREKELDGSMLANLTINPDLFEVSLKEIKLISILGAGGSDATVYKAEFNDVLVAFKQFKTSDLCSSQDNFDEFEKEVSILSSLSHPNTLRFYGAVLEPPRVGIVMEFCSNGDLHIFLQKKKEVEEIEYPLNEKIRMLHEIAKAMGFLHSRKIIHRDLKPENVLIDGEERCKVMDFGCSKFVERMSRQKTKRIGTPFYMAPDIVLGDGVYNEKVDCFSFGVMIFCVISMNFEPYGTEIMCVELKVANDPEFRPNTKEMKDEGMEWLKEMAKSCWKHDPNERMSMTEVCDIFKQKKDEKKE